MEKLLVPKGQQASDYCRYVKDPLALKNRLWPHVTLYDKQIEIINSVWDDDSTFVPAGHMLGKDFISGFIALAFFLTRNPCRVVTTSVDGLQLEGVLWGEIRRFMSESAEPLTSDKGGPIVANHMHLRKTVDGKLCGISYCIGRVAARGEGMSGHHVAKTGDGIPRTLFMGDEASGLQSETIEKAGEWHDRALIVGNPYDCHNAFKWAVTGDPRTKLPGGDIRREGRPGFLRRVIRIRAEDSPNVRHALDQKRAGVEPTGETIVPGVLGWEDYCKRRKTWDPAKQKVGLDAEFYEGAENLLFPPWWLDHCEALAAKLAGTTRRAKAIGIDPGQGEADTSMAAIDDAGLIELVSQKTPDPAKLVDGAIDFIRSHGVEPSRVCIDLGGGGREIAAWMRRKGYRVRTVGFGQSVTPDVQRGRGKVRRRQEAQEERYAFTNRRSQLYGELREAMDPAGQRGGFAIPAQYHELRRQLAPMPLVRDGEGRLKLPPKSRKPGGTEKSLEEIIGRSPDDADALVLSLHALLHENARPVVSFG